MLSTRSIEWRYNALTFLFWFSTALPMAVFILLAQARGMSLAQIGLLSAIYSVTIVLLEVPTGGLADTLGRGRVAALAEAVTLAGWIVFLFAFSFPTFVAAFLLNGIGRALASGSLDAWFVDRLLVADPDIDLHPRLSRAGAVTLAALGLGTVSGGLIVRAFSFLPPDGTAVLTPFAAPGLIALPLRVVLLLAILVLIRDAPSSPSPPRTERVPERATLVGTLRAAAALTARSPILLRLLAVTVTLGLALSAIETLWQPRFAALLGDSPSLSVLLGIMLAGSFLLAAVGNLLAPWLTRRSGHRPGAVCAVFHALRGAFLLALALQTSPLPAAALFWLVYATQGVVLSTHRLLLNEQIPSTHRSSMLSIESLVSYLGGFVGSAGLGWLADRFSIPFAWGLAGSLLLVSWGLYWKIDRARKEQRGQAVSVPNATDPTADLGRSVG
jgi:MFS family permease